MSMVQTLANEFTLAADLSPVDRDRNYKGRIRQIFSTLSAHPGKSLLINLMGVVFWAPLFILFLYILPYIIETNVLANYTFAGSLGIGYGASSPEYINKAIQELYIQRIIFSASYVLPCVMFASIGMSGVYNCMRNMFWEVECKIVKHFFVGIKRHWYKFLIVYTVLGAIATGFTVALLEIRMAYAIGVAPNAGWWVMIVLLGIIALIAVMYSIILIPMLVTYKYDQSWYKNFAICLKNAGIIVCISPLQIMLVSIFISAPLALCLIPSISIWIVIIIALYGIAFYVLITLAYSQFYSDNYIYYLYNRSLEDAKKQQAKEAKAYKAQQKAKQGKQNYKKKKK